VVRENVAANTMVAGVPAVRKRRLDHVSAGEAIAG